MAYRRYRCCQTRPQRHRDTTTGADDPGLALRRRPVEIGTARAWAMAIGFSGGKAPASSRTRRGLFAGTAVGQAPGGPKCAGSRPVDKAAPPERQGQVVGCIRHLPPACRAFPDTLPYHFLKQPPERLPKGRFPSAKLRDNAVIRDAIQQIFYQHHWVDGRPAVPAAVQLFRLTIYEGKIQRLLLFPQEVLLGHQALDRHHVQPQLHLLHLRFHFAMVFAGKPLCQQVENLRHCKQGSESPGSRKRGGAFWQEPRLGANRANLPPVRGCVRLWRRGCI